MFKSIVTSLALIIALSVVVACSSGDSPPTAKEVLNDASQATANTAGGDSNGRFQFSAYYDTLQSTSAANGTSAKTSQKGLLEIEGGAIDANNGYLKVSFNGENVAEAIVAGSDIVVPLCLSGQPATGKNANCKRPPACPTDSKAGGQVAAGAPLVDLCLPREGKMTTISYQIYPLPEFAALKLNPGWESYTTAIPSTSESSQSSSQALGQLIGAEPLLKELFADTPIKFRPDTQWTSWTDIRDQLPTEVISAIEGYSANAYETMSVDSASVEGTPTWKLDWNLSEFFERGYTDRDQLAQIANLFEDPQAAAEIKKGLKEYNLAELRKFLGGIKVTVQVYQDSSLPAEVAVETSWTEEELAYLGDSGGLSKLDLNISSVFTDYGSVVQSDLPEPKNATVINMDKPKEVLNSNIGKIAGGLFGFGPQINGALGGISG